MRRARRAALAAIVAAASACSDAPPAARPATAEPVPWQRTEERAACATFDPLRQPLFGDLHVHTRYSADAHIFGTRVGAREAYDFARGGTITLADDDERQTRTARIDRPLDFAAVTDHSEFFGEVDLCIRPESPLYDDEMCRVLRQADDPNGRFEVTVRWLFPAGIPSPPRSHAFCSLPGIDCDAAAVSVWQEMQAAAEAAYDRTEVCSFTTFVGYEHTASPLGRHLHRNVIFRNHHVPEFPSSQLETAAEPPPHGVWTAVERDCLAAGDGCDAVIIPHNSNLSGGEAFPHPIDAADARRRQEREPLIEIHQVKGNSECRFDRLAGLGVGGEDELCAFEQREVAHEGPDNRPAPDVASYPRRNLVRNVLKDGVALQRTLGVNPFQFGFVGSTDTHNATSGDTEEAGWAGAQGNADSSPARRIGDELRNNPGGLAVVWAEENSRDALFAALERRETYATSGTRPVVRLFAGELDGVDCGAPDLVERAYRTGTPMGGEIGALPDGRAPRFVVLAAKDPGTAELPGADLQRVQIVKGWVDAQGATHERVFDVAGGDNGAAVDPSTCAPLGAGAAELCAAWQDPAFDPRQDAFYYARVLENPTCRWSTLVCKEAGVDPFAADCAQQAARVGEAFADCCLTLVSDAFLEPVVQERAWTSPVWYRPDAIARVRGSLTPGRRAGEGALELAVALGRVPEVVRSGGAELTVVLSDAQDLFRAVVGPGGPSLEIGVDGVGLLRVAATGLDLAHVRAVDQMLRIRLEAGDYRAEHTRRWRASGDVLTTGDEDAT
ncbi:MAG: DUF3604 domain-containing protein [Thermodesulfobacteriota bacterium]